ncbi:hypothetical protein LCGC14_0422410 [marine sediment metagenome]|uniref:Uncharacterized protein n=1 Tax=marine sediment metagenome TaxID=412755 RepID=A0A0F9VCP6_9ZZZZ
MKSIFTWLLLGLWAIHSIQEDTPIPIEFNLPSLGALNGSVVLAVAGFLLIWNLATEFRLGKARIIAWYNKEEKQEEAE